MFKDKLAHFIDGPNAVQITFALSIAPGKQAVAAEDQALGTGVLHNRSFQHQGQFKSGTLPGEPADFSPELSIEFL